MNTHNPGSMSPARSFRMNRFAGAAEMVMLLVVGAQVRTWTRAGGSKTFEGELNSFDPAAGECRVFTREYTKS